MKNFSTIFIIASFTFLIVCIAILFQYIFPLGDDYMMFTLRKGYGVYGAIQFSLQNFGGRYFSYFLNCLADINPKNFTYYRIQTFLYFLFFLVTIYHFFHQLFYRISFTNKLLLTSVFFIIYFLMMFSTAEGFFWHTAVTTYMIANSLSLLFFSLLLIYYRNKNLVIFILSIFVMFLLYGLNEISLLYNTFILFCILIYQLFAKEKFRKESVILFILSLFLIVFYLSFSGNTNRENLITAQSGKEFHNQDLLYSIFMAFRKLHITFLYGFWLVIFLIPFLLQNVIVAINEKYVLPKIHLIIAILIWIAAITIGLFASYYGANWYPNGRMLNVNAFYVWFATFFFSLLIIKNFLWIKKYFINSITQIIAIFILLISIFIFPNNIKTMYNDLFSGKAIEYKKEMNKNYFAITACKTDSCKIQIIKNKPFTIIERRKEQSHQFQKYYLSSYSDYFKKEIIIDSINYTK